MTKTAILEFQISVLECIWNHAKGGCVLWHICQLRFGI